MLRAFCAMSGGIVLAVVAAIPVAAQPSLQIIGKSDAYPSPQTGTIRAAPGSTLTLAVVAKMPQASRTGLSLISARFSVTPTDNRLVSEVYYAKPTCWMSNNINATGWNGVPIGSSNTLRGMKAASAALSTSRQRFDLNNDGVISVDDWTLFIRAYAILLVTPETEKCNLVSEGYETETVDDTDVVAYYSFLTSEFQQTGWGDISVHLNTSPVQPDRYCDSPNEDEYQQDETSIELISYNVTLPRDVTRGTKVTINAIPSEMRAVEPETYPIGPGDYPGQAVVATIPFAPGSIVIDVADEPIEFVDPTLRASSPANVNYVPNQLSPLQALLLAPEAIETLRASQKVAGVACDGATRIAIVWPVPGPGTVEFNLAPGSPVAGGIGSISYLGDTVPRTSLFGISATSIGQRWYAFAMYLAPSDFWRSEADSAKTVRSVAISARYTSLTNLAEARTTTDLLLRRPPVLLVHGLKSDSSVWDEAYFQDSRYVVYAEDYSETSSEHFEVNSRVVSRGAFSARHAMRQLGGSGNGFACTKVSVVGHSMGGLLARIHASNTHGQYFSSDNQGQGDIYKLITLYSPHRGSGWACAATMSRYRSIAEVFGFNGESGAILDLRPDSSAISQLAATNVPTHAIAGTGGDVFLSTMQSRVRYVGWPNPGPGRELESFVQVLRSDIVQYLGSPDHDAVVSLGSAAGGLSGNALSIVREVEAGEDTLGVHWEAGIDTVRRLFVLPLLDKPVSSPFFAPALPANGPITPPAICLPTSSSPLTAATSGGVSVNSPSVVDAGGVLRVLQQATGDFVPDRTFVLGDLGRGLAFGASGVVDIPIPIEAVGEYEIRVISLDRANRFAISAPVSIFVSSRELLVSLRVAGGDVLLSEPTQTKAIQVIAQYTGVTTRNVSRDASYSIEKPEIVDHIGSGVFMARRPGSTSVQISFGGKSTTTNITVLGVACPVDLTGDSLIDDSDFSLFAVAYNRVVCDDPIMPAGCPADFNRDGFVDDLDFQLFVIAYDAVFCS